MKQSQTMKVQRKRWRRSEERKKRKGECKIRREGRSKERLISSFFSSSFLSYLNFLPSFLPLHTFLFLSYAALPFLSLVPFCLQLFLDRWCRYEIMKGIARNWESYGIFVDLGNSKQYTWRCSCMKVKSFIMDTEFSLECSTPRISVEISFWANNSVNCMLHFFVTWERFLWVRVTMPQRSFNCARYFELLWAICMVCN
jgi:hypothetical protein